MSQETTSHRDALQTKETRMVEDLLRKEFSSVDAYRYNSASIRVRVIDPRFEGLSFRKRVAMVEPLLDQLPEATQADVMNLLTLYPGESEESLSALVANTEFEDPSSSIL